MIKQSEKTITSKTHFIHENGKTYCGSQQNETDTYIVIPNSAKDTPGFFIDEHLCGVCWCVWLSLSAELVSR